LVGWVCLFLFPALAVLPSRADKPKEGKVVFQTAGYVVPIKLVTVSPQIAGQVIELKIEEGKLVKKGDVLARLNARGYRENLEIARAEFDLATARLERVKGRGDAKDLAVARAEVAVARARLAKAQGQVEATVIRAPLTGTILAKKTEEGNTVDPRGFQVSASICEMADLRQLEVNLDVQERDISKITRGQACLIQLDAFPKTTYKGQVSRLMPVADRAKGAIPVRVKIDVPAQDTQLRPEMRALVSFLSAG
jgi:RND family efflux transporter MFP subunit